MKKLFTRSLALVATALFLPIAAGAQVPELINFQGRLLSGTNMVNGSIGLSLRLFDAETDGSLLYEDSNTVAVVDGLYSTFIGDDTISGTVSDALTYSEVYIEVAPNGIALAPRERLASVGFSLVSQHSITTHGLIVDGNSNVTLAPDGGNAIAGPFTPGRTISGGQDNSILNLADFATIGGGYGSSIAGGAFFSTIGGGNNGVILDDASFATIAGGNGIEIRAGAAHAFVGGGEANIVDEGATHAVITGGHNNRAGGIASTVLGGQDNDAANTLSLAAGNRAKASHVGSFVWGDASDEDIVSTNANSVTMRATGGYYFYSATNLEAGIALYPGSGAWTTLSDLSAKKNLASVDAATVLDRLAAIPVYTWSYKAQPDTVRHMGPTAQDFKAAFNLGETDTGISTVDADGVALAAIKALAERNSALEKELRVLRERLEALEKK